MSEDTSTIRATNGIDTPRYLPGFGQLDRRTQAARHFRDVADSLVEALGGPSVISPQKLETARNVAGLSVLIRRYEIKILSGEDLTAEEHSAYLGAVNAQGRALGRLGFERVPKDVTPSLQDYLHGNEP